MIKDTLFLLAPGFADANRREYCPECAEVWGLLNYFPAIKEGIEFSYQPLTRPRQDLASLLGDQNQNCPTLLLHADSPHFEACGIQTINGSTFIDNARDIGCYYARRYGIPFPRGS